MRNIIIFVILNILIFGSMIYGFIISDEQRFSKEDPNLEINESKYYDEEDVLILSKIIYGESRGIYSLTEQSCIIWTVLNRVDSNIWKGSTIKEIALQKNQFAYNPDFPTVDDYGRDITILVRDVLDRYSEEKAGKINVGRTLPNDYYFYGGDGRHNYFRQEYDVFGNPWNFELTSPYES